MFHKVSLQFPLLRDSECTRKGGSTYILKPLQGERGASYALYGSKEAQFIKNYAEYYGKTKNTLSLAQATTMEYKPFIIDLDMTKKIGYRNLIHIDGYDGSEIVKNRILSHDDILIICGTYISIFREIYGSGFTDKMNHPYMFVMLRPFVTIIDKGDVKSKSAAFQRSTIKDGLHIIIPDLITSKNIAKHIQNKAGQLLTQYGKPLWIYRDKISKVIDTAPNTHAAWMLYGCAKNAKNPYKLSYLIDLRTGDKMVNYDKTTYNDFTLPEILNLHGYDEASPSVKQESLLKNDQSSRYIQQIMDITDVKNNDITDEDTKIITEILDNLSIHRAKTYVNWRKVGHALYKVYGDDVRGFNLFKKFTERGEKNGKAPTPESRMKSIYYQYKDRPSANFFNKSSLYKWLKEDNHEKFVEISRRNIIGKIRYHQGKWRDYDIAEIVDIFLNQEFVTTTSLSSGKKAYNGYDIWWFKNHRWNLLGPNPDELKKRIVRDFITHINKIMKEMISDHRKKSLAVGNAEELIDIDKLQQDEKNFLETKLKPLRFMANKLKDVTPLNNVLKAWCSLANVHEFGNDMDTKDDLIGLENGVFDLASGEFRPGRPEDKISMTTKCPYIPGLDFQNNPEIKAIYSYFENLIPNKDTREFIYLVMASQLRGNTNSQRIYILCGEGSCGKSKFVKLKTEALGDYSHGLSSAFFTQKTGKSSEACPDVAAIKGRRYVTLDETEGKSVFNLSLLKKFSGGNKITFRGLYEAIQEMYIKAHFEMQVNNVPDIGKIDNSVRRRLVIVPFECGFYDEHQYIPASERRKYSYIKHRDPKLDEKIHKWAKEGYFITLLLHYYKTKLSSLPKEDLPLPNQVQTFTNNYFRQNDFIGDFIRKSMLFNESWINDAYSISLREFRDTYKQWISREGVFRVAPSRQKDIEQYLEFELNDRYRKDEKNIKGYRWIHQQSQANYHPTMDT